ncbi:MAG: hypothetical protein P8Y54_07370, partial [Xanthomonadales bacterium]
AITLGASASPSGGKGLRGDAPRLSKLQDVLGLSDEQVTEIRAIRANGGSRDDVRAVLSEEQRTMLDTHRARRQGLGESDRGRRTSGEGRGMHGRSPRMAHLQQALGLSDEQAAEIRTIRANGGSREDVRAVLTDEQRALMDEHRANRQGRRDSKQGHGKRSPGQGWRIDDPAADSTDPAAG